MTPEAIYITVNGIRRRITDPSQLEEAVREIVRAEVLEMQDEGLLPSFFDRPDD